MSLICRPSNVKRVIMSGLQTIKCKQSQLSSKVAVEMHQHVAADVSQKTAEAAADQ